MKLFMSVWLFCLFAIGAFGAGDIDLGGKQMTFTNLDGRVYSNVLLETANLDGVVYFLTNGAGGGMVKYKDLSTNFLASLHIPLDRVQIAAEREQMNAEQKLQYEATLRALALRQQEQQALAASNTLAAATAQSASANAAKKQSAASPKPPRQKERPR
jgi:hypothetical protein